MATTDYTALDHAIVQAIAQGKNTANNIEMAVKPGIHKLRPKEDPILRVVSLWRTIDRRLQALRKRGDITFCRATRTWRIAPKV